MLEPEPEHKEDERGGLYLLVDPAQAIQPSFITGGTVSNPRHVSRAQLPPKSVAGPGVMGADCWGRLLLDVVYSKQSLLEYNTLKCNQRD